MSISNSIERAHTTAVGRPEPVPEIVLLAQDHVGLGVQRGPDLAQPAPAAAAHQAVLVPVQVERLQQEPATTNSPLVNDTSRTLYVP